MRFEKIVSTPYWEEVADKILVEGPSIILVLGDIDTGKTIFCQYLGYKLLQAKREVCFIDGDIGQSTISPPATIGIKVLTSDIKDIENIVATNFYYVGSVSPQGHLLQLLTGVKLAVEKAYSNNYVLIDTTGLVKQSIGNELKIQKINLIKPHFLIAIQRNEELQPILKNFYDNFSINVMKLSPSKYVRVKTRVQRRINRQDKFKAYFKKSNLQELDLKTKGLFGEVHSWQGLKDSILNRRLIGLCDKEGQTVGLAIIERFDFRRKLLYILSPIDNVSGVKSIQFGSIFLDEEFNSIGG